MSLRGAALALTLLAAPAAAQAPEQSLHPQPRPVSHQETALQLAFADLPPGGPHRSLRPALRPEAAEQALFKRRLLRKGAVCGSIDIQGEEAGEITGHLAGCGSRNAVRVKSVSGVALSTPALMECDTAKALKKWVEKGVKPAFKRDGGVVSLRVAAHYSCRTRNSRAGAELSEHGRARAIDISGFTLGSGETVTVLHGWQDKSLKKRLEKAWKAACGPFRTVLGPEADRHHRDHFHLDTAKRRSTYCR